MNRTVAKITALGAVNMNIIDYTLDVLDDRTVELDVKKADQSTVLNMVSDWSMDEKTGIITITKLNGEKIMFDLNIEKIPVNFSMSEDGVITMKTEDGTTYTADISKMIPVLTFNSSDTIMVNVTGTGKDKTYTFDIKDGSITPEKLNPDYLAALKVSEENAKINAESAAANASSASKDAKDAKQYRDEAEQFKNQAFSGTPEGYEQLADNVDELMEKSDRAGITGKVSGESIHATDTTDNKAVEFALHGKATQKQYSGKNLLKPYLRTVTNGGITLTVNEYGSVEINGTSTSGLSLNISQDMSNLPNGKYTFSMNTANFSSVWIYFNWSDGTSEYLEFSSKVEHYDFEVTDDLKLSLVGVTINQGNTFNNLTFYPMIRLAIVEDSTWEPYVGGIPSPNPEYKQDIEVSGADGSVEVKSVGKNLLNPEWLPTQTVNGVTLINNGDNTWTFSGAETNDSSAYGFVKSFTKENSPIQFNKAGYYRVSISGMNLDAVADQYFYVNLYYNGAIHYGAIHSGNTVVMQLTDEILSCDDFRVEALGFWVTATRTAKMGTIGVQIEYGTTATELEPYKESAQSISTPNGLAGIPVSSGGNYVDGNGQQWVTDEIVKYADGTGKKIQRICHKTYNGSENVWSRVTNETYQTVFYGDYTLLDTIADRNTLSNMFLSTTLPVAQVTSGYAYYNPNSKMIYFAYGENSDDNTLEGWKEFLSNNNLEFYYVLAEPIVTDLTAEEIAELEAVRTFYPTTNILNDAGCGMEVEYVREVFVTTQTAIPFTEASEAEELKAGDTLGILFGKIKKLLKKGISLTNNLLATVPGTALDATQGKILNDKYTELESRVDEKFVVISENINATGVAKGSSKIVPSTVNAPAGYIRIGILGSGVNSGWAVAELIGANAGKLEIFNICASDTGNGFVIRHLFMKQ